GKCGWRPRVRARAGPWIRRSGWRGWKCRIPWRDRQWRRDRALRVRCGSLFGAPALRIFLAQFLFGELADQGLGQGVLEDDILGHFDLVELVLEEGLEVGFTGRLAGLELDIGHRRLAAIFVGNADDIDLLDRVMGHQRLLDGARIDIEARADDEVLDAIDEEDIAVRVHVADIAGAQPALHEGLLVGLGILVIAGHDLRTLDLQLAIFADADHIAAIDIDEAEIGTRQGQADGHGPARLAQGGAADHGRGFGEAIALGEEGAGFLREGV